HPPIKRLIFWDSTQRTPAPSGSRGLATPTKVPLPLQHGAIPSGEIRLLPLLVKFDEPLKHESCSRIVGALRIFQAFIASDQERLGFAVTLLDRQALAKRAIGQGNPVMFLRQRLSAKFDRLAQDRFAFFSLTRLSQDQALNDQSGRIVIVMRSETLAIDFYRI